MSKTPSQNYQELVDMADNYFEACQDDLEGFSRKCCELLKQQSHFPNKLEDVFHFLSSNDLNRQHFHSDEFANFNLTLARGKNVFLDLYVWTTKQTDYHSHHFCGAFKVLSGSAKQIVLDFEKRADHGDVKLGKLKVDQVVSLEKGDAYSILLGERFIHRNFYVKRPGMTICLRTNNLQGHSLHSYYYPGVGIKHWEPGERVLKQADYLRFLHYQESLKDKHIEEFCEGLAGNFPYSIFLDDAPGFKIPEEELLNKVKNYLLKTHDLDEEVLKALESARINHEKMCKRDLILMGNTVKNASFRGK